MIKNLFELPELLTLSGQPFESQDTRDDGPYACAAGCNKGCLNGIIKP